MDMRSWRLLFVTVALCLGIAAAGFGGVLFDAEKNIIHATDFPAGLPCTLKLLLAADRQSGWGKVTYDEAGDAYTVAADIWIGANDGTETYFQIGGKKNPKETLIIKGNVVVYPYWVKGENEGVFYKVPRKVNRLQIGDPQDESVTAALKFDCERKNQFTFYIGTFPKPGPKFTFVRGAYGGQLHVYNGIITAATQDAAHTFGSPKRGWGVMLGRSMILRNATLSWVSDFMAYGAEKQNSQIVNTTFEHGGAALVNGRQEATGCTFRNCGVALKDWGGLNATVTDCVFENNDYNWTLTHTEEGVTCIDCVIGKPKKGNIYTSIHNEKAKRKFYPKFASKRHIIVEVVGANGKPVPGAAVEAKCEQTLEEWEQKILDMTENSKRAVNDAGRTPKKGEERPILLTEVVERATDTANQPEVKEYAYTITAAAGGATGEVKGFCPKKSWEVVRITLK